MLASNHTAFIGLNARENIREILINENAENILVVHGKQSYQLSGADNLLQPFLADKKVSYFSNFTENPNLTELQDLVIELRSQQPDLLMAVGGGSAMDIAKAGRALTYSALALDDAIERNQIAKRFPCQMIAIPTTAGTGSEATHFAVIYKGSKKYSLAAPEMLPDYAIIDPMFSSNMPDYLRACTLMDALCQAIESFWSVQSTKESESYAEKAITLIRDNAIIAMETSQFTAKSRIAEAAYYAGRAINISKTTAAHALSYWLTSRYHIPHGHAVALNISRFLFSHDCSSDNFSSEIALNGSLTLETHRFNMQRLFQLLGVADGTEAARWVINLMRKLGLKTHWHEFGLDAKQIATELIKEANLERMKNNPLQLNKQQLYALLTTDF